MKGLQTLFIAVITMIIAGAAPQAASAQTTTISVELTCPTTGETLSEEVTTCSPGRTVSVEGICGDSSVVTTEVPCPEAPQEIGEVVHHHHHTADRPVRVEAGLTGPLLGTHGYYGGGAYAGLLVPFGETWELRVAGGLGGWRGTFAGEGHSGLLGTASVTLGIRATSWAAVRIGAGTTHWWFGGGPNVAVGQWGAVLQLEFLAVDHFVVTADVLLGGTRLWEVGGKLQLSVGTTISVGWRF
jgi:hypothetical protein